MKTLNHPFIRSQPYHVARKGEKVKCFESNIPFFYLRVPAELLTEKEADFLYLALRPGPPTIEGCLFSVFASGNQ